MKLPSLKEQIKMTTREKDSLWQSIERRISSQTEGNNEIVRIPEDLRHTLGGVTNPLRRLFPNNKNMTSTPFIVLALGLMGATTSLAQHSLPGDTLYPVKIHFNENVRIALAISAESDAQARLDLIENRIEEKEALQARGDLDIHTEATIDTMITASTQSFQENSARLQKDESKATVRSDLEIELRVLLEKNASISLLGNRNTTTDRSQSDINTAVNSQVNSTVSGQTTTNNTSPVNESTSNRSNLNTNLSGTRDSTLKATNSSQTEVEYSENNAIIIDVTSTLSGATNTGDNSTQSNVQTNSSVNLGTSSSSSSSSSPSTSISTSSSNSIEGDASLEIGVELSIGTR